jgi:mannitol/fructose-specific phosphotransferase system IIA component (Ntr-type)
VDFAESFDWMLVLVVFAIASVGKMVGCTAAARGAGLPPGESLAIAAGMNARGAMGTILGLLGLEAGLIDDRLFVAIVVMSVGTSMVSGTLVQRFLGRRKAVQFTAFASGKTFMAPIRSRERVDAVADMGRLAAEGGRVDVQMVVDAALSREQVLHSGVGHGVAVPHARVAGLAQPVVAVGVSPEGIAWGSRDGRAVRIVIFLLTPEEDARLHLDLLASIATVLRDPATVELAVSARTWTEFLAAIKTSEAGRH